MIDFLVLLRFLFGNNRARAWLHQPYDNLTFGDTAVNWTSQHFWYLCRTYRVVDVVDVDVRDSHDGARWN